jgi:peptide/nickel transport system ATP-binding protein
VSLFIKNGLQGDFLILEIQNLSIQAKKKEILKNVSIGVMEGRITSLIGESGSGKSTLLKKILGLDEGYSSSGKVYFSGEELKTRNSKIQIVFQDPIQYFNPHWGIKKSLFEPITIFRKINLEDEKKLTDYLKLFSLENSNLNNLPKHFSGGELQRLAIIRAMLTEPKLLLMDEPVSGLDRMVLEESVHFLRSLRDEKKITIFLISHDLEYVQKVSDYIYILKSGEIIESGTTNEIFQNPKKEYTKELISSRDLSGIKNTKMSL